MRTHKAPTRPVTLKPKPKPKESRYMRTIRKIMKSDRKILNALAKT